MIWAKISQKIQKNLSPSLPAATDNSWTTTTTRRRRQQSPLPPSSFFFLPSLSFFSCWFRESSIELSFLLSPIAWCSACAPKRYTCSSLSLPRTGPHKYPLPGYIAPLLISFSPNYSIISYLFNLDGTLSQKVYCFNLAELKQEPIFSLPDGGLDKSNLSVEEKLRREQKREWVR